MPQQPLSLADLDAVQQRPAPSGGGVDLLADLEAVQRERGAPAGEAADTRSFLARAYDAVFTPPEAVTRGAASLGRKIDEPELDDSPLTARIKGFFGGAVEGAASLLTPGDVALTATGYGPLARAIKGVKGGAQVVDTVQRGANVATAARGVERLANAESIPDAAAGIAQTALGVAGSLPLRPSGPLVMPPERRALPPGPRFVAAPDGRVAPVAVDIPMEAAPDGSFVRGMPAEYATHEVRGLLPPGPRFVADAAGNVAPSGRASELLAALDDVQGRPPSGPDTSGVRGVRAAVLDREVDAHVPARGGVTVSQYSSDPAAVDAPFVSDADRPMLERMRHDLAELRPEPGRLVHLPGGRRNIFSNRPNMPGGSSHYVPPTPGSPVGDDIRVISEQNVGNREILGAIDDLLAGKPPTNRLHTAAMDAVRGYAERREGYRGPLLPPNASRQYEDPDDGFEAFARIFDDGPEPPSASGREPGEEGFADPRLLAHVASGMGGAAYGAETGEDTKDSAKRAILFGVAGAAAPALLRGRTARVFPGAMKPGTPRPSGPIVGTLTMKGAAAPRPNQANVGTPYAAPTEGFDPLLNKFSNPLVRNGVAKVIADNGGFGQQRRGAIDTDHLGRFADEVRVSASRVLPKGTALNAEQITAYGRALQETTRKVDELAQVVNSGRATDADLLALQVARAEQQVVAASFTGARSEAGRALSALNFWGSVLDTGNVTLIRDAAGPLREEAAKIAAGLAQLPNDPLARYQWLKAQSKVSPFTHLRSYYLSNLLSGPKTHFRNVLGNLFNAVADTATLPLAAGIDAAKSAIRGSARTVRLSELPATVQGSMVGVEKGLQDAFFALQHGIHPAELTRTVDAAATRGKLDLPHAELPGGGANPLNWPFRLLHAPDALAKAIAREGELSAVLFNHAKSEGRTGKDLIDRISELRGGVTPEAVALRQQASEYALRRTFLEKPGDITNRVVALAEVVPGSYFVLPFIRISAAIARQGAQFSPFGFFMRAAQAEGRTGTQAQARALAGTMAAGYFYWLASTGRLSGDGPRDPAERESLMASGWRPNSVKVGDKWIGYQVMQPVSVPMAAVANGVEAWKDAGANPQDVPDVLMQTLARTANTFVNSTFLSGVSGLMEAMNDPDRSMSRFAARTATGLIPASSLVRSVQQGLDPVVRQPRGIVEGVKANLPGLSTSIPPRVGRFGDHTVREGGAARRILDPFSVSTETNDPIGRELDRLGIAVGRPSNRIALAGGRQLTGKEGTALQQLRGRAVRELVERVMRSPGYPQATDEVRIKALERAIEQGRRQATEAARGALARELQIPQIQAPQ